MVTIFLKHTQRAKCHFRQFVQFNVQFFLFQLYKIRFLALKFRHMYDRKSDGCLQTFFIHPLTHTTTKEPLPAGVGATQSKHEISLFNNLELSQYVTHEGNGFTESKNSETNNPQTNYVPRINHPLYAGLVSVCFCALETNKGYDIPTQILWADIDIDLLLFLTHIQNSFYIQLFSSVVNYRIVPLIYQKFRNAE